MHKILRAKEKVVEEETFRNKVTGRPCDYVIYFLRRAWIPCAKGTVEEGRKEEISALTFYSCVHGRFCVCMHVSVYAGGEDGPCHQERPALPAP